MDIPVRCSLPGTLVILSKKPGKKRPKIPAFSEFHDRLSCHRAKQKANNKTQKPNKTHKKHPTPKTSTAGESAD